MRRLLPLVLFAAIALASLGPIRNYDLFWHLATGRWISEHRALPASDPFAVASDRGPWINGEWLFELALFGAERAVGIAGLSWVRSLFIAALFAVAFLLARGVAEEHDALLATALAFAGAMAVIDLRPSGIAALFVLLAIATLCANRLVLYVVLTILWINVHPSALLAPILALMIRPRTWMAPASAAALLVNPHLLDGVLAPLRLMAFVTGGEFVNAEWLPSHPLRFPLLYVTLLVALVAYVAAPDRRVHLWRWLPALLLAYLAVRHVRNQPLWFAAFPLLVAPAFRKVPRTIAYAASLLIVGAVALRGEYTLGVSPSRFPIEAVARLQSTGLRGNIYNPDQFGGFLIWSFYPERRALTDGRNELYRAFIPEYARARRDSRAWSALLRRYRIDLAVDEYRPPLEVLNAATRQTMEMPASLAFWPRRDWALIGYDEAALVFARRAAFPRERIEPFELKGVVPDARR